MALELIVNLLLLLGCIGCYINVSTTMPHSAANELGAEQWPQGILILLIVAICYNLFKYFRAHKQEEIAAALRDFFPSIGRLVKSKLFVGMALVVLMALMYEPIGFIATCMLFLIAYGLLLGQRNLTLLLLTSVIITVILYIGFSVMLGVMLPRGQVMFLRNFALLVESLVPHF